MSDVDLQQVGDYLVEYVGRYRDEYARFVDSPPRGGGYPPLEVSPFIRSAQMTAWLAPDGFVLEEVSGGPARHWDISGGPAIMSDEEPSRTPAWVRRLQEEAGVLGKSIGIYRVVAKTPMAAEWWEGRLPEPVETAQRSVGPLEVECRRVETEWRELIARLTYGVLEGILPLHLPDSDGPLWEPRVVGDLGFFPADRSEKRFFRYLELSPHVDSVAWDQRAIPVRVRADVRRDFSRTLAQIGRPGGTISFGGQPVWSEHFIDRINRLAIALRDLRDLLETDQAPEERVVHEFLDQNSQLLDVYGEVESKPRFEYPPGESPLGKQYVEPDFLVKYPGQSYRLIEIERPGKRLDTRQGQARAEVTQAAFQIAEWRAFVQEHYDVLKSRYPGIASDCRTTLIVGRDSSLQRDRDAQKYKTLLKNQFGADEVLTYDDLLVRTEVAIARLAALSQAS